MSRAVFIRLSRAVHFESTDVWILRNAPDGIHLVREEGLHIQTDLGVVQSVPHAQALARRATGRRRVHFAPHPLLTTTLPLWGSTELSAKRRLRVLVAGASAAIASREMAARAEKVTSHSAPIADAIGLVDWRTIHSLPHSSSRQRLLFFQIKGLRVSGWDSANGRRGCPHCAETGSAGGTTFHIVWECPAAQRLWRILRSWWSALGLWTRCDAASDHEFLTAVFSLRLPRTPPNVWDLVSLPQCPRVDDAPEGPYPALQAAWQQLVLETFVVILGWRRSCRTTESAWTPTRATVVHDASCQNVLGTLALRCSNDPRAPPLHALLLRELRARFSRPIPTPTAPATGPSASAVHVLFFDGGSRGNPGPGGAGACVLRVDIPTDDYRVVWSAAMSHAHRATTNNQAEYQGLIVGLRAARLHRWPALEVVGDSALIIRQLRDYSPPKNPRLLRLYAIARRLADQVGVCRWFHHLRTANTMADSLANLAMNQAASSQALHPTDREGHADVHMHLDDDVVY